MLRNSNVGKSFNFQNIGYGVVLAEARHDYQTWSSSIQILEFTDPENKGAKCIRFGYCDDTGKLIARPLYLSEGELNDLGKEVAKNQQMRTLLKRFCEQIL